MHLHDIFRKTLPNSDNQQEVHPQNSGTFLGAAKIVERRPAASRWLHRLLKESSMLAESQFLDRI